MTTSPSTVLALTHRALAFWNTYVQSLDRRPEGFLRTLVAGQPDWSKITPYPRLAESDAAAVERLFAAIDARRADLERDDVDAGGLAKLLGEMGLAGMTASREAGGAGLPMIAALRVVAKLAESNLSASLLLGAHAFLNVRLLERFAPEETKQRWLPRLISGEAFAAYAISEPGAGSDLAAIMTTVSERDGAVVLDGEKTFVSGGTIAQGALVAATGFGETDADRSRPSVCWVPLNGVARAASSSGHGLEALGGATLRFDGTSVECLLGGAGQGNAVLQEGLTGVRLAAAASALGATRALHARALAATKSREQFGRPVIGFEMCREKLARAAAQLEAMEAVIDLSASLVDRGIDASVEAAAAKVFCTRAAAETASSLLELVGAVDGSAESGRLAGAIPALKWVGGSNDVLKLFIVLEGSRPVLEFLFRNRAARKTSGWFDAVLKKWWRGVRLAHRRPRIPGLSDAFREPARILSESAGILAERTFQVCEYHLNEIVEHQYEVRRLAEMTLEVWPLTAQILRADAARSGPAADADRARVSVRFRARRTWRRVARWSSQIFLSDDGDVERLMEGLGAARTEPEGTEEERGEA